MNMRFLMMCLVLALVVLPGVAQGYSQPLSGDADDVRACLAKQDSAEVVFCLLYLKGRSQPDATSCPSPCQACVARVVGQGLSYSQARRDCQRSCCLEKTTSH